MPADVQPPPPAAPPPIPQPFPPPPPARKKDRTVWVILVVLAVAFAAIAAAFVWATGGEAPPGQTPTVTLSAPVYGASPGDATVNVTGASEAVSLAFFRAELRDVTGGTLLASALLKAGTLYQGGGAALTFQDAAPNGKLNAGDLFSLVNFPTQRTYTLTLAYTPADRTVASVTINL